MSAMDFVIELDDQRYINAVQQLGPLAAEHFRNQFNISCVALTGFEHTINNRISRTPYAFVAPIDNISVAEH